MHRLLITVVLSLGLASAAFAAPPQIPEIATAVQRNDAVTLSRALAEDAVIRDLSQVDPDAAVGLLLDIADGLSRAGKPYQARQAANRAIDLAVRTWGAESLELVEPLRRRAEMTLALDPWDSLDDIWRAKGIVFVVAGHDAGAYADLDDLLRRAEARATYLERLRDRDAESGPPPPPPPPPRRRRRRRRRRPRPRSASRRQQARRRSLRLRLRLPPPSWSSRPCRWRSPSTS